MRILHLAYEDFRQPGSGGGAIRTREVNRRLGDRHEITALVAGYPGAKPRFEDGVRWVPIGPRTGTKIDRLAYFTLLGPEVIRRPHDLVVEDFSAPFGPGFSPIYTRKPVIASVQWLFASQMREKYRLPFDWVENRGIRFYDRFIAISGWLARSLETRSPEASIEVIPEGVEGLAYEAEALPRKHLLFVGRLDMDQKGGDLLLDAYSRVASAQNGRVPPLLVVGDGPDRKKMEKMTGSLGISRRVQFRGRIEGPEKYRLMASSYAVLMPSRYETFGMVAAESLATGTPVVSFDIGPLREVVGGEANGARLVAPYDLDAFAREVAGLIDAPPRLVERYRQSGRRWARRYDWGEISARQEDFYERSLERLPPSDTFKGWRSWRTTK